MNENENENRRKEKESEGRRIFSKIVRQDLLLLD